MENKKQLVIVPPMSEPFQKLSEVLHGIADDENIDISMIDDPRELSQFIGSAGQSLISFSDAKRCALFLQENRFILAKTHSKVILLTPKLFPEKTLAKFVKLGLTESILETSAPKTLLYKVKLLLRSIKSSAKQEEKDQVVKSMLDLNATYSSEKEIAVVKIDENNTLKETPPDEDKSNESEGLVLINQEKEKPKEKYVEDSIETNWKSKKKNEDLNFVTNSNSDEKDKSEDLNNIDLYYRGETKKNQADEMILEAPVKPKKRASEESQSEKPFMTKESRETDLDINDAPAIAKKNHYTEENEQAIQAVKGDSEEFNFAKNDELSKQDEETAESKALSKKKEFDELEALFEAAKKRQSEEVPDENQEEDSPHYPQSKVINSELELESRKKAQAEENVYDNSELHKRKSETNVELSDGTKPGRKNNFLEEENNSAMARRQESESMELGTGAILKPDDEIIVLEDEEEDSKKTRQRANLEITEGEKKKRREYHENENNSDFTRTRKDSEQFDVAAGSEKKARKEIDENRAEEIENNNQKQQTEINLEDTNSRRSEDLEEEQIDENAHKKKQKSDSGLQLIDGKKEKSSYSENEESEFAMKKRNHADINLELEKERKYHDGKTEKIDTFFRGGEASNTEQDWENLADKKKYNDLGFQKTKKKDDEMLGHHERKDAGEITIDYRMLKEEFANMSKGGHSYDDNDPSKKRRSGENGDIDDAGLFKVVEIDSRGFIFAVDLVNLLYQKELKNIDFYKKISEELISQYKAFPVFYHFKTSENKHSEVFDSFMQFGDSLVPADLKEWWMNTKNAPNFTDYYFEKTMTTWLCKDIPNKNGKGDYWEDIELPSWAATELKNKKVEMVFPYYDGVDRMGVAVLFFPEGVNAAKEKSITVTLEMARTILLDSIERKNMAETEDEAPTEKKKNILSLFSGMFNRNKAS